jgi:hypothetical protein
MEKGIAEISIGGSKNRVRSSNLVRNRSRGEEEIIFAGAGESS